MVDMASVQFQLDVNDIPESANEPGPGHYFGPESSGFSSLGKQKFAKCRSAPEISLPRTGWDNWSKVIISKGHNDTFLGKVSDGAKYELGSALDTKTNKIGTALRPDLSKSLGVDPDGSPGPVYNVREAPENLICEAPPPKNRADKSFGLAERFRTDMRNSGTGPGQYRQRDVALRADSGRSIGTGRASWEKVITPGWEVEGRCRVSPGVGPPNWTNINKNGSRAMSIGRAERFPKSASESCSPGPAYNQGERECSRVKQFISDTKTPTALPFGAKPKKPRFRQTMVNTIHGAKHGMWGYH